jgi:WD40 repeat protein
VASRDARAAGTFPGCGGSEELISVSLGMVPRRLRVAAARVTLARRGLRLFASADEDKVKLWDPQEGRLIADIKGAAFMPSSFARCFRIADDRSVLWAGPAFIQRNPDGSATLGRAALKRWRPKDPTIRISQHPEISAFFAVSGDGRRALVSSVRDGSEALALYEPDDAPRLVTLPKLGRGVSTAVMSGDGRWAATADFEHDLFVWSLDRAIDPLPQPAPAPWHEMEFAGFSKSGRCVFETAGASTIIDIETGTLVHDAVAPDIWRGTPDSRSAAPDSDTPGAKTRRVGTRRRPRKKTSANDYPVDDFGRSRGHTATVNDHRQAPNGRWDVTVSHDGTARVWEIAADRPLAIYASELGLAACQWSPDSRTLAVKDVAQRTHLLRLENV